MTLLAPDATKLRLDREPTADELYRIQEEAGVEFVDGKIVEKNVSLKSSTSGINVSSRLFVAAEGEDVAVCDSTLAYKCFRDRPNRFRKPDASVVRRSRLREVGIGDDDDPGELTIPPDLAVEVVSPNDRIYDVRRKVREYLAAGFGEVWLLFPDERAADVYRGDDLLRLGPGDELTLPDLLPKFRVKVSDLFA